MACVLEMLYSVPLFLIGTDWQAPFLSGYQGLLRTPAHRSALLRDGQVFYAGGAQPCTGNRLSAQTPEALERSRELFAINVN